MMGSYSHGVKAYESSNGVVPASEVAVQRTMYGMAVDQLHFQLQAISIVQKDK